VCAPVWLTGAHMCAPVGEKTAPWRQGFKVKKLALLDALDDCLS
jgi:hypothetical protein